MIYFQSLRIYACSSYHVHFKLGLFVTGPRHCKQVLRRQRMAHAYSNLQRTESVHCIATIKK